MQMNLKSYRRAAQSYADALPSMSDLREHLPDWRDVRKKLPDVPEVSDRAVAKGLGWVSIAIGLSEILAPRKLERTMGIGDHQNTGILRVLGVREVMQGVDILSHKDPTPGLWARVAGDLLDGVLLTAAGMKSRNRSGFMTICALVLPVVVLDMIYAKRCTAEGCER